MAMDNMTIRKAQLEKLDAFVKTLYDETQVFKGYGIDLKDAEMLYMHIHELIQELLSCDTTEEFMDKVEQLHKAIAGVLIVMVPADLADQIKADMSGSYEEFNDEDFEEFIAGINKNAKKHPPRKKKDDEEDVENDPEELVDILDLKKHVKKKSERVKKEPKVDKTDEEVFFGETPDEDVNDEEWTEINPEAPEDPMQDVWDNFKKQ